MRLSRNPQALTDAVILRQSLWFALLVTIAAWLQILRVLGPVIAVLLAAAFIAIEAFLRVRENLNLYDE
jgi:hypothetical protein